MHEAEIRRMAKMETTLAELEASADTQRASLAETWDAVTELRRTVDAIQRDTVEIRLALMGDMDQRKGLITRVHEVEASHTTIWRRVDELAELLTGKNGGLGLVERLRILETVRARNEKLSWILVSAIVAQLVLILKQMMGV
jgi:chromosome segregation ATPase